MDHVGTGEILAALFLSIIVIIYLLSLGGAGLHRNLQNASIWALIFVGTIAAVGLWDDIQDDIAPRQAAFADQGRVEVPRDRDGHYCLTLELNGAPV